MFPLWKWIPWRTVRAARCCLRCSFVTPISCWHFCGNETPHGLLQRFLNGCMKPLDMSSIASCSRLPWPTEEVNLPIRSPLSVPRLEKYEAESSIVIPSALTRRVAVRSPTNLSGAFFLKVHPLTTCSRAMSCSWWATSTLIRRNHPALSRHSGNPRKQYQSDTPTSQKVKTRCRHSKNIRMQGWKLLLQILQNTSTSAWHIHFYAGCPIWLYANIPAGMINSLCKSKFWFGHCL